MAQRNAHSTGHPTPSCKTLCRQAPPASVPATPLHRYSALWGVLSNFLSFPVGLVRVPEDAGHARTCV